MTNTLHFNVDGMTCGGCARTVRQALATVPGVTAERVVPGAPVEVSLDPAQADRTAIEHAIEAAGYRAVFTDAG